MVQGTFRHDPASGSMSHIGPWMRGLHLACGIRTGGGLHLPAGFTARFVQGSRRMASSANRSSNFQWVVVALPGVGAAVMLAVLGLGWAQARRSAEMVLRGEAALLIERVNRAVRENPPPVTDESLRGVVDREARAGLLFVAAVGPDGEFLARSGPVPDGASGALLLRPGDFLRAGGRAWARSQRLPGGTPPPRRGPDPPPRDDDARPGDARPRPPRNREPRDVSVLILFEPSMVGRIDRVAAATLLVGLLGAAGLIGLGALALRLLRRNEEALRRLERERHMASLGTMSAVVAHELRNPLAGLKGHAQLLVESLDGHPREKAQAQRVVDGALRLERLSESLLDLSRLGDLAREPVAPASIVRAVVAQSGGDRVLIDDAEAPVSWAVDPIRFQQVVVNLVDNALQADPVLPVNVRLGIEAGRLVLEVRDRGPGVPEADRERIFEPFVTTRARGVGLGLAVARQVVALHGGSLTVRDAAGGGACFRVEIPPA
jgi:two-component system sensor histidine kinase HydH